MNLKDIEQELAYEAARADIEGHCPGVYWNSLGWRYRLTAENPEDAALVERAASYLKAKKLLKAERHDPGLYKIMDRKKPASCS